MRRRSLLILAGATALAGCSAPPPADYRLAPVPGPTRAGAPPTIAVRDITIPAELDQDNIPMPGGTYQFNTFPNAVWSEPFDDMLRTVMVQNLAQRLPGASVIASGGAIGAPAKALVEINLLRFDPDPQGDILLIAQIAIKSGTNQAQWRTDTFSGTMAAAASPAGVAAAMSALWGMASDRVAEMLGQ